MPVTKDTIGVGFVGAGDIAVLHAAAVKKCVRPLHARWASGPTSLR